MSNFKYLRQFKPEELLFNEDETRTVLKFIFAPTDHEMIDSLPMSDALREFAQGLLVEAIDASHAVGFVKAIQESAANPTKGAREILKSFARKAAIHWFKHATVTDLMNVKVYQFVLDALAIRFRDPLRVFASGARPNKPLGAFLAYQKPTQRFVKIWS